MPIGDVFFEDKKPLGHSTHSAPQPIIYTVCSVFELACAILPRALHLVVPLLELDFQSR